MYWYVNQFLMVTDSSYWSIIPLISGDLRVCTYCCKIVLSYLQSSDMRSALSADLKALQEDLQVKYGNDIPARHYKNVNTTTSVEHVIGRKQSVGYMEENYAIGRYVLLNGKSMTFERII